LHDCILFHLAENNINPCRITLLTGILNNQQIHSKNRHRLSGIISPEAKMSRLNIQGMITKITIFFPKWPLSGTKMTITWPKWPLFHHLNDRCMTVIKMTVFFNNHQNGRYSSHQYYRSFKLIKWRKWPLFLTTLTAFQVHTPGPGSKNRRIQKWLVGRILKHFGVFSWNIKLINCIFCLDK